MHFVVVRGIDLLAVAAALAAIASLGFYLAVMQSQDTDNPATWVLVVLSVAALLCLSGAPQRMPQRAVPLLVACLLLGGLGVLSIFSIGFVVLAAACLAFCAFLSALLEELL